MPVNFGSKKPLSPEHTRAIQSYLIEKRRWRDLTLFMLGVDTLLRSCDLLKFKYEDVVDVHGNVRTYLTRLQNKTRRPVECYISEPTRQAVRFFIENNNKQSGDYLFTRLRPRKGQNSNTPITRKAFAELVKHWVSAVGLDPTRYSTKTLRKSRVRHILEKANYDYQVPRLLLGHSDIRSTVHYCAIAEETALQISSEVQFFDPNTFPNQEEG